MSIARTASESSSASELALDYAARLITRELPKEFDVQAELGNLLGELGFEPRMAESTASGVADVYLPQHKTVVETKRRGQLDPDSHGSLADETQSEQLMRYVRDLAMREQAQAGELGVRREVPWKGLLTDGLRCYLYRFDGVDGRPLADGSPEHRSWAGAAPLDVCDWLTRRLGDSTARRTLPAGSAELAGIFQRHAAGLERLHRRMRQSLGTQTKHSLWLDMNRGSGFDVADSDDDLFRSHTLLVHGAEAVVAMLLDDDRSGVEIMLDGFATWPQNRGLDGEPTSVEGADWTNALFDAVRDYDWRSRGRDVLRDVYESLIPKRHRKAFGEYYTPDWLSAAVVHEVLDDAWCERAIASALESIAGGTALSGIGALDPACGSGTFLYHAARRILGSDAMRGQFLDADAQAQVVLRLVNGIDVHPIAVSIARATLLRAMPDGARVRADEVNVYQADSLGIERRGGVELVGNRVDRIVANPPWVVMKDIQVETRKRELEGLIGELGLSVGGRNASTFDIAGLFVARCRELYLRGDAAAAGWVLNWGAMKGQTWARVRERQRDYTTVRWDLSAVKGAPFTGAKSCVWVQRGAEDVDGGSRTKVLRNVGSARLLPTDDQRQLREKTCWVTEPDQFAQRPSAYEGRFHRGADLFPHCLVLVVSEKAGSKSEHVEVTLARSRHAPWNDVRQQSGEVPESMVRSAVTANQDLLPFGLHTERSRVLIGPRRGSDADVPQLVRRLDRIYRENCGKGGSTPQTLADNLDFNGKLSRQLASPEVSGLSKVVYNRSGQVLRSARVESGLLVDTSCYWTAVESAVEARYLTAVLNAPCLQLAFQQSRTSDRDFHLNPLQKVPVPAFERDRRLHRRIAELCREAESIAGQALEILAPGTGQIKASTTVRRELLDRGVARRLDRAVRELMPEHAVGEYDASAPHPWR